MRIRRERRREEKKRRRLTTNFQLMILNRVVDQTLSLVMIRLIIAERMNQPQHQLRFITHQEEDQIFNSVEQLMNDYFNTVCIFLMFFLLKERGWIKLIG